jgi:hypothetical protein
LTVVVVVVVVVGVGVFGVCANGVLLACLLVGALHRS